MLSKVLLMLLLLLEQGLLTELLLLLDHELLLLELELSRLLRLLKLILKGRLDWGLFRNSRWRLRTLDGSCNQDC